MGIAQPKSKGEFAKLLSEHMTDETRSVREIERTFGLSNGSMAKWMKGQSPPKGDFKYLQMLAEHVGLGPWDMFRAVSRDRMRLSGALEFHELQKNAFEKPASNEESELLFELRNAGLFEEDYRVLIGFTSLIQAARKGSPSNRPEDLLNLLRNFSYVAAKDRPRVLKQLADTVDTMVSINLSQMSAVAHELKARRGTKKRKTQGD